MQTMLARDVMHPEVLGVRVDMTVREAAGFLTDNQIGGAPVLDRNGHLVGVVSLTDLAENEVERPAIVGAGRALDGTWQERVDADDLRPLHLEADDVLVREIMTPTVYTVPDDTPVTEIARAMIAGRIHRLFVTRKRRVVGIVTPLDLLRLLTNDAPPAALAVPAAIRPHAQGPVELSTPRKKRGGRVAQPAPRRRK
jgi:CBS domain-containing protein